LADDLHCKSAFAIGNGIVTATIVGGVLPMFEPLFQITTDISWLEAVRFEPPAFAAHDNRSAGHLPSQFGGREPGRSGGGSDSAPTLLSAASALIFTMSGNW
jgi:hypothetical protein